MAIRVDTGLVKELTHVAFDVAHTEQLEEGLGDGQVHKPVILDAFGQKDAKKQEKLSDALKFIAVLGKGSGEKAAGTLNVEAGWF